MTTTLRPYQVQMLEAIRSEYLKGTHQQLILSATGTGKTVVMSHIPEHMRDLLPGRSLILAHREELIDQAITKMKATNPHLSVTKEMGGFVGDANADVIVASVATLGREGSVRGSRFPWDQIDKVTTDEAHHSTSSSYSNIYALADVVRPDSNRLHCGFTASGQRADGKALAEVFRKVVFDYPLRKAIEEGYLVDIRGYRVKTNTSLAGIRIGEGGGQQDDLADRINNPERNQTIVKAWLDHAPGLSTVAFTANIKHAEDLAAMFRHYGVRAEAVWGDDPDRAKKLAMFEAGEITVICNCAVLTEGWDCPRVACVILARPSRSGVFFAQAVGRSTRLYGGKQYSIVLDIMDMSANLSLLTLPTLMGLPTTLDLQGRGVWDTVKVLEEAAKDYPAIDFSKLVDINSLQTFIEDVNLFEVKFPEEVEVNSDLTWYTNPTGGYILQLPKAEELIVSERYVPKEKKTPADKVTITQNLLDKYTVCGNIKGKRYRAERETVEEAFRAADGLIDREAPDALKLIQRKAEWHDGPASEKQLKRIRQLYKDRIKRGMLIPPDLDKGSASKLISQALLRR